MVSLLSVLNFLLSVLLLLPVLSSFALASLDSQGRALIQWRSSLESHDENIDSWNRKTNPCNWTGITCSSAFHGGNSMITMLSLPKMGQEGTLDVLNFSALATLTSLNLALNKLHESIPTAIAALSALPCGKFPSEIGSLAVLSTLNLSANQISGFIPPSLGNLRKLRTLHLYQNNLSGTIPTELGSLESLLSLDLSSNFLHGPIPHEIGHLPNLNELAFSNNSIAGPIPSNLGNLTKLTLLHLRDNKLSGSIPHEIGYLSHLNELDFSRNRIAGPIPSTIGSLTKLTSLL